MSGNRKQNLTAQYASLHLNQAEYMMRDAIIHKTQFSHGIALDSLWQAEMFFSGDPIKLKFQVYTQSSKAIDKNSGAQYCEFELQPGATQAETQYTETMNRSLNSSGMKLIPYTQMLPIRQDILAKCINLAALLHSSPMINQAIETMQKGGDTGMQQVVRNVAKPTENDTPMQRVINRHSTSGVLADKPPVKQKKKGFMNMFKR